GAAAEASTSGSGTYVIPVAVRLTGSLEREALQGALHDLVARHESLRTVFPETSGVPRQEVLPAPAARVALEISSVAGADLAAALSAAAGRGFELSHELPLRAHLFAVESGETEQQPSEHVLLLVLHHIAGDGWSLRPLLRDLGAFYRARLEGGMADLPLLPV